jgi:hypothetical protein
MGEGTKQHIGEADECEHAPIDGSVIARQESGARAGTKCKGKADPKDYLGRGRLMSEAIEASFTSILTVKVFWIFC